MSTKGTWTPSTDPGVETRLALWIRFENDAMQTPPDAARALLEVVDRLRRNEYRGVICDDNGNTVGAWDIEAFSYGDKV